MYAEDVPCVILCGRPKLDEHHSLIHHSAGAGFEQSRCYEGITASRVSIFSVDTLPSLLEQALTTANTHRKPVLVEIACNLFKQRVDYIGLDGLMAQAHCLKSVPAAVEVCVGALAARIVAARRVIIVVGKQLPCGDVGFVEALANALGCPVVCMVDAKGTYTESRSEFVGVRWGQLSAPFVEAVVDESDLQVMIGCVSTDFNTVGHSMLTFPLKEVNVHPMHTELRGIHHNVLMDDVLRGLAELAAKGTLPLRPDAMHDYARLKAGLPTAHNCRVAALGGHAPLRLADIQRELASSVRDRLSAVVVDTGDALFWAPQLHLGVKGTSYHTQMLYASIGWSIGASLGVSFAVADASAAVATAASVAAVDAATTKSGHVDERSSVGHKTVGAQKSPTAVLSLATTEGQLHSLWDDAPGQSPAVTYDDGDEGDVAAAAAAAAATTTASDGGDSGGGGGGGGDNRTDDTVLITTTAEGGRAQKEVICVVGDGALQMTASELSSFVRYGLKVIVLVVNNQGYAVEDKIHDGDYNRLQNWNYADLADVFNGPDKGTALGLHVLESAQLGHAMRLAHSHSGSLVLIECCILAEDVSAQLMEFGPRLGAFTYR
jgi:TPP-dependent 2-oxoacid decarboxylase